MDRKPINHWGRGLVTLLGDAAHPTTPNLGHGACMAIQDAVVLAVCLHQTNETEAALRSYEKTRQPKTAAIVNQSHFIGVVGQFENPLACWMRNVMTRLIPPTLALKSLESVFYQAVPNLPPDGTVGFRE